MEDDRGGDDWGDDWKTTGLCSAKVQVGSAGRRGGSGRWEACGGGRVVEIQTWRLARGEAGGLLKAARGGGETGNGRELGRGTRRGVDDRLSWEMRRSPRQSKNSR